MPQNFRFLKQFFEAELLQQDMVEEVKSTISKESKKDFAREVLTQQHQRIKCGSSTPKIFKVLVESAFMQGFYLMQHVRDTPDTTLTKMQNDN